ncbi:MAG: Fic family protein [Actinobacteria bacterium]|nr:Fic family protein [Actinomycetota bacterium]
MYVETPPDTGDLLAAISPQRLRMILRARSLEPGPNYVHWDKLRYLEPPDDLSHEEWWLGIKLSRQPMCRGVPLADAKGNEFTYSTPDIVQRLLHHIDQRCAGEIAMPEVMTADEGARQHYLVNSLMEEAIRSSQLEGATTSRRVAKDLLQTGRSPRDRSERMILNNYRALNFMREQIGDVLTPEAVLELQRILTDGTLDDPDEAGRLQTPDDERVAVFDRLDNTLIHKPPKAEQLPTRLRAMCDFANDDDEKQFIHPVIRAILLHFWLAYDHPFADGNGRTARALFYWYMRTRGYWLTEYLTISNILRTGPAKYTRAFLLSETDEGDLTYFIVFQLKVIRRAVDKLHDYLRRKAKEVRDVEPLLKGTPGLNHRQIALLGEAMRSPDTRYTFRSHATSYGVTHETARNDLSFLVGMDLLERHGAGRPHVFVAASDLAERLKGLG